jgi:hypothetical protein
MDRFSLRLPRVGVAAASGELRGYMKPERGGPVELRVKVPAGARSVVAWVDGRRVASTVAGGFAQFDLQTLAGKAGDWAVTWKT